MRFGRFAKHKEVSMKTLKRGKGSTEAMVLSAVLTSLVVILQLLGSFIRFGPFSISLVLIPIVIGAATCGPWISGWLGLAFGVVVLIMDAAFLAISIPGTIITVLLKGVGCGLAAGFVYKLFEKKNKYLAVAAAAIVCPLVNTGIFVLGCLVFFMDTLSEWGLSGGFNGAIDYLFFGMIGANFLFELASNAILSPVVVRLLNIKKKSA